MTFEARYHGSCGTCGEHICPGDSCEWVDDEIVHALCETPAAPTKPAEVCTDCWMTKPCWCDAE